MNNKIFIWMIIFFSLIYFSYAADIVSVNKSVYSTGCLSGCGAQGTIFSQYNINDGLLDGTCYPGTDEWIADMNSGNIISIDLGGNYTISEINIMDEQCVAFLDREPSNIDIDYSDDNSSWISLVSGIALNNGIQDNYTLKNVDNFSDLSFRYIRLSNVIGESGLQPRIAELTIAGNLTDLNTTPSSSVMVSPCNVTITINNSGVPVTFNWTASIDLNPYQINYNISLRDILFLDTNIINTNETIYQTSLSSLIFNNGTYRNIITSCNEIGNCNISESCYFNICTNDYMQDISPCVDNLRFTSYHDNNLCNIRYAFPQDNGTYQNCTVTSNTTTTFKLDENLVIFLLILFLFIVFMVLSFKISLFFLIIDGLIFAFSSFYVKSLLIESQYSLIIFILLLITSIIFILGGIFGGASQNK